MTELDFDIELEFYHPQQITQSISEPDYLTLNFTKPGLFIDKIDFTSLATTDLGRQGDEEKTLSLKVEVPPQQSHEETVELVEMGNAVAAATTGITITVLLAQVCLYFGLKYLWNIMNLIQFLIFMQMWLLSMPGVARIFMQELKALALLEFIPYAWL